jgi:hypothetical protein
MIRSSTSNKERLGVLTSVIAVHLCVILLVILHRTTAEIPDPKATAITAFAVEAQRPTSTNPPPPALPSRQAIKVKPVPAFSTDVDAVTDDAAGASTSCSTAAAILDALLLDPVAVQQIRDFPPETRSIAGAVVIWNEDWAPAAASSDTVLGSVRGRVEQVLASSPDPCLDEAVAGPRLLPIPDGHDGTIFLVIGSGNWRWRALLSSPLIPTAVATVSPPNSPLP